MASIVDVSTPVPDGDRLRLEVPPGWRQGRGAYGGLCVGALIRAIERRVDEPQRKVRSVTAELPGPLEVGAAEVEVEMLRRGNSVSTVRAAIRQGGEVRSHAVAILAAPRPSGSALAWRDLAPPEVPPWRALPPSRVGVPDPAGPPWPEFTQHFEFRPVVGMPLSGGEPRTAGWVRPREPVAVRDAGFVASMIDTWWPAAMVRMRTLPPMATIAFTLELVSDLEGLDPEAPLLYRGSVPVCGDGYFLETRELWGEDGRLIARNHQTFAVIA
ncbi:MAG: thioesterase family protein [Kofleriaceae bacterium]